MPTGVARARRCWANYRPRTSISSIRRWLGKPMASDSPARLAGKTAVVTAAASGIGRASAEAFARAGARVLGVDIDGKALATLPGCEGHVVDVRDANAIAAFARTAGPVDVLFNCAGMVP